MQQSYGCTSGIRCHSDQQCQSFQQISCSSPMLLTVRLPAHFQPPTFLACKLQAACAVSPHYVRTSKSTHLVKGCERVKPCCHHVHVIGPGWTAGAESMADPLAAPRTARSRLSGSERAFARIAAPSPPSALPSTHWRRRCTLTPLHVLCAPFRDSLFYVPPQMGLPIPVNSGF